MPKIKKIIPYMKERPINKLTELTHMISHNKLEDLNMLLKKFKNNPPLIFERIFLNKFNKRKPSKT
jgi:DNA replication protein DnaD